MKGKELEGASDALGDWFASQDITVLDGMQVMVRTMNTQIIARIMKKCNPKDFNLDKLMDFIIGSHRDIAKLMTADAIAFIAEALKDDLSDRT
jgi:hypothetical protein